MMQTIYPHSIPCGTATGGGDDNDDDDEDEDDDGGDHDHDHADGHRETNALKLTVVTIRTF